jgi:hypothetical protein
VTLVSRAEGPVEVDDHILMVLGENQEPVTESSDYHGGLVAIGLHGGIVVYTGIAGGGVRVELCVHDLEPVLEDQGWDQVVDVSATFTGSRLVAPNLWTEDDGPSVALPPASGYRLRCSAKGRDHDFDNVVEESQELYRFDVWPAPSDLAVAHKCTDQVGVNLHPPQ